MQFHYRSGRPKTPARAWLAPVLVAAAFALAACDVQKIAELEVGVTTEADVRAKWGEPAAVYTEDDGTRVLEYPRQPAGQVNYMLALGKDGKLVAMHQVLKPATFAKIEPGWDKTQVRRLIGRAAKAQTHAQKNEEVWDWRYADGNENKLFSVTFDMNGRVMSTASTLEGKEIGR